MKSVLKKIGVIFAALLIVAYFVALIVAAVKGVSMTFLVYIPMVLLLLFAILFIVLCVVLKQKGELVGESLKDLFWR